MSKMALILSHFLAVVAFLFSIFNGADAGRRSQNGNHWVDTWVAMPQLVEATNLPNPPFNQTGAVFVNSTLRQTIHTSIGGCQIRLRISNAFGLYDLPVTAVTVSLPFNGSAGASAIQPHTLQSLTFSGSSNYTIPNGALVVSDPINFCVEPQSNLAVTMYLEEGQLSNDITGHPGSRVTTWMSEGNHVSSTNFTDPSVQSVLHWYFISALEVYVPQEYVGFVIVGDSLTDGRESDNNENDRWPDLLLRRMQANKATSTIAVLNQAAGGNRILYDGLGPNALGRIDRDVISHSNIQYAMIFEGVNDIGTAATDVASQTNVGTRLIAAFTQIALRVHTFGIPIFAATITPFSAPGYNVTLEVYSDPEREKTRQRVNKWIRESGTFDAVIDFDAILRDPKNPYTLDPSIQSGDWLHPNETGYQRIANDFPLNIFD